MGEYLNFINKYSSQFDFELQYNDYLNIKSLTENTINEILSFRGVKIDDMDSLIPFTMCFLLANHTPREILTYGYEDEIESVVEKAYNKENSEKPVEEQKPFPEKNDAVDYIYKDLKNIEYIFKENFNIGLLSKNIKDSLVFDGYKENDILEGKADETIIEYLAKGFFDVRFSEDFKNMRSVVSDLVVNVFNYKKKDTRYYTNRDSFEYLYYDNRTIMVNVIFKLTIAFIDNKVNPRKLTSNSPEMEVIYNYIQKDMIRINSTREKSKGYVAEEVEKWKKLSREEKEERIAKAKKAAIIFAIIFGLVAVENMIYNSIHSKKDEKKHNRNKYNVETNAFDIDRMAINVQNLKYNASNNTVELPEESIEKAIESAKIDEDIEVLDLGSDELTVPEIPDDLMNEEAGEKFVRL